MLNQIDVDYSRLEIMVPNKTSFTFHSFHFVSLTICSKLVIFLWGFLILFAYVIEMTLESEL